MALLLMDSVTGVVGVAPPKFKPNASTAVWPLGMPACTVDVGAWLTVTFWLVVNVPDATVTLIELFVVWALTVPPVDAMASVVRVCENAEELTLVWKLCVPYGLVVVVVVGVVVVVVVVVKKSIRNKFNIGNTS